MSHSVKVGTTDYALVLVHGALVFNGQQVDAVCHHDRQEIDISDTVSPENRMLVAAEAVSKAWQDRAEWLPTFVGPVD